ncbi:MAG: hypothetical protein ACK55Z_00695, partial [bacterium]
GGLVSLEQARQIASVGVLVGTEQERLHHQHQGRHRPQRHQGAAQRPGHQRPRAALQHSQAPGVAQAGQHAERGLDHQQMAQFVVKRFAPQDQQHLGDQQLQHGGHHHQPPGPSPRRQRQQGQPQREGGGQQVPQLGGEVPRHPQRIPRALPLADEPHGLHGIAQRVSPGPVSYTH